MAWLSLDEGDNEATRFFAHLLAAVATVNPTLARAAQTLLTLPQLPPDDALLAALLNPLADHFGATASRSVQSGDRRRGEWCIARLCARRQSLSEPFERPRRLVSLSPEQALFTVLVRYTVPPEDQAELVEVLERSAPTFTRFPGFVSLTMHRALDGAQVVVYLQWRSQADSEACMTDPVWMIAGQELMNKFFTTGKVAMEVNAYAITMQLVA